jgi:hypothetical protein
MKTAQYGIANIVDWKQFGNKLIVTWQAPMDICSGTLELSADHPDAVAIKERRIQAMHFAVGVPGAIRFPAEIGTPS